MNQKEKNCPVKVLHVSENNWHIKAHPKELDYYMVFDKKLSIK